MYVFFTINDRFMLFFANFRSRVIGIYKSFPTIGGKKNRRVNRTAERFFF